MMCTAEQERIRAPQRQSLAAASRCHSRLVGITRTAALTAAATARNLLDRGHAETRRCVVGLLLISARRQSLVGAGLRRRQQNALHLDARVRISLQLGGLDANE